MDDDHQPPWKFDELREVVLNHFGPLSAKAEELVAWVDDIIVSNSQRHTSLILRKGGKEVRFNPKVSAVSLLRRQLDAIKRADAHAYRKASLEEIEPVSDLRREARQSLGLVESLGDFAIKAIGPDMLSLTDHPMVWAEEIAVVSASLKLATAQRRPARAFEDSVCVELIEIFEFVSGLKATVPGYLRKKPLDARGTMTGFVKDGLNIYGLGHAWPGDSRSSWERIIKLLRK